MHVETFGQTSLPIGRLVEVGSRFVAKALYMSIPATVNGQPLPAVRADGKIIVLEPDTACHLAGGTDEFRPWGVMSFHDSSFA